MNKNFLTIISFSVIFLGMSIAIISGGVIWGTQFNVQAVGSGFAIITGAAYLAWQDRTRHPQLIRSNLEWLWGICLAALILSLGLSINPRQGIGLIVTLLAYLLLFYLLVDAFEAGLNRKMCVMAILLVSGIVLASAAIEVYIQYLDWWLQTGNKFLPPPFIYRFSSLMGHANIMMGLINLCAPMAVTAFITRKNFWVKVGTGAWLLFFLITLPFSSSRGGWIGSATWIGVLFLLWGFESKKIKLFLQRFSALSKGKKSAILSAGMIFFAVIGYAAYSFWAFFAAHPSHGSNIFGGRADIWSGALKIWQSYPHTGAGPGRFAFEYLKAIPATLPGFWAQHAHSLPLQSLAEHGLLGFLTLLALIFAGAWHLLRHYQQSLASMRPWNRAALAGIASWLAHSLLEQLTIWPVAFMLILLLAWIFSTRTERVMRWGQIDQQILWLPGILLAAWSIWSLWSYYPMSLSFSLPDNNQIEKAALISLSAKRDPQLTYYDTQAGLAWSEVWQSEPNNAMALNNAIYHLQKSLGIENAPSLLWANLAVLDWQQDQKKSAVQHLHQAIILSPYEPSYPLNLGYFMEQDGQMEEARQFYLQALTLAPNWGEHPFWQQTPIRIHALIAWQSQSGQADNTVSKQFFWQQAWQAFQEGRESEANLFLAKARWAGEPAIALRVIEGRMAEQAGNLNAAVQAYEQVAQLINRPNLHLGNDFAKSYAGLYRRKGLSFDLVPGYIQLESNMGQFSALEHLQQIYLQQKRYEEAENLRTLLEQAISGQKQPALFIN